MSILKIINFTGYTATVCAPWNMSKDTIEELVNQKLPLDDDLVWSISDDSLNHNGFLIGEECYISHDFIFDDIHRVHYNLKNNVLDKKQYFEVEYEN